MIRKLLTIFLICWALPAAEVTGKVSAGAVAVPGASVAIRANGQLLTTVYTDENGAFTAALAAAPPYEIEVTMFGFHAAKQTLAEADLGKPLNVALELQAMRVMTRTPARDTQSSQMAQTLNTQITQALNNTSSAALPSPSEGNESSDSVLVQGSVQRAALDFGPDMGPGGPDGPGGPGGGDGPGGAGPGGGGPGGGGPGGGMGGGFGGGGFRGGAAGGGHAMGGGPGGPGGGGPGGPGGPGGMGGPGGGMPPEMANMTPEERQKFIAEMRKRRAAAQQGPEVFGNNATRRRQQYRGGAFWTFGNSALDAAPYALNGLAQTKPEYSNSSFGATIGGPLPWPKSWMKTSFFFLNYSATRGDKAYSSYGIVPTEAQRLGDFSSTYVPNTSTLVTLFDPTTKTPISGNVLALSQISSVAKGLLTYFPTANQTGATQNYRLNSTTPQNSDSINARINRSVGKNRYDVGLNYQRRSGYTLQSYGFQDDTSGYGINANVGFNRTINSHFVLSLSSRFNINRNETTPYFAYGTDVASQLGISGTSRDPLNYGPPNLSFTNFLGLTDGNAALRRVMSYHETATVRYTRGTHALSFGADYSHTVQNLLVQNNARGTLTMTGNETAGVSSTGGVLANSGYDLADFLLGYVRQSTLRSGGYDTYPRQNAYALFAQDEWNIRKNLSLNFGVRYDFAAPFTEKYNRMVNLDIAPGFTAATPVVAGGTGTYYGTYGAGLVQTDYNKFSPRIGIAYRPGLKRRTVIRSGFSIFYDNSFYSRIPGRLTAQPPYAQTATYVSSTANLLTLANPFTGSSSVTVKNTYAINPLVVTPRAATWSLSVEHELPGSWVANATYMGTKGTHLDVAIWPNVVTSTGTTTANASGYTYDNTVGNSIFNAMQLRINRRMRHGVHFGARYQWAKAIDNATTIGGGGNNVAQNPNDLAAERGLSSFDRRHTFSFDTMIASPFGPRGTLMKRGEGFLVHLLEDWSATTNLTLETGVPLTATVLGTAADASGTGAIGAHRADATGLSIAGVNGAPFNLAAFTTPAGLYGTAGRNTIPGPGMIGLNASLGRTIQFGESARRSLDIRLSANNVLNHVNVTSWGTVVNSATYGLTTAAGSMRSITLSFRARF